MLVNLDEDTLKDTATTSVARTFNATRPNVPLAANGNVIAQFSGFSKVQSSDNVARFDADGNAVNLEPKTSFLFPIAQEGFQAAGLSGGWSPAAIGGFPPTTTGGIAPDFYSPNYVNGYNCPGCSAWVPNGIHHSCNVPPNTATISIFPKIDMKPHKCPVCEGKGQVPFNPAEPLSSDRDKTSWPCKPCSGGGVLWQ